jgi:phage/plasmid-like protein (TIGR03299 family)
VTTTAEPVVIPARYRASADWDAYEAVGRDGLAETETGHMLAVSGIAAWHGFGHVQDEDMSVSEAMINSGLHRVKLDKIPQTYNDRPIPGAFWIRRLDTDEVLSGVGSQNEPQQPRETFAFLEEIAGEELKIVSAGGLRGKHGQSLRAVFITARMPEDIIVKGRDGHEDTIAPFLSAVDYYDNQGGLTVMCQPWRIECSNTVRWALRDAVSSWKGRHTKSLPDRMRQARETLRLAGRFYEALAQDTQVLLDRAMSTTEIVRWVEEVYPDSPTATAASRKRTAAVRDQVVHLATEAPENSRVQGTALAAMCGLTSYLDHYRSVKPARSGLTAEMARDVAALEGDVDFVKDKGRKLLLVRR